MNASVGWEDVLRTAVRLIADKCPRLVSSCYWAGTSAISTEVTHHRRSFDLDFHTRKALEDVRPLLAELHAAFSGAFRLAMPPDRFGSGFRGALGLPSGEMLTVEVLANFEDVPENDLTASETETSLRRITIERYLADKIQCIVERTEARDLVDIRAVLARRPDLVDHARRISLSQDGLILAERLLAWTDAGIRKDLTAYDDADPSDAIRMRDELLAWLKESVQE